MKKEFKILNCEYFYMDDKIIECRHSNNFKGKCITPCFYVLEDRIKEIEKEIEKIKGDLIARIK